MIQKDKHKTKGWQLLTKGYQFSVSFTDLLSIASTTATGKFSKHKNRKN